MTERESMIKLGTARMAGRAGREHPGPPPRDCNCHTTGTRCTTSPRLRSGYRHRAGQRRIRREVAAGRAGRQPRHRLGELVHCGLARIAQRGRAARPISQWGFAAVAVASLGGPLAIWFGAGGGSERPGRLGPVDDHPDRFFLSCLTCLGGVMFNRELLIRFLLRRPGRAGAGDRPLDDPGAGRDRCGLPCLVHRDSPGAAGKRGLRPAGRHYPAHARRVGPRGAWARPVPSRSEGTER